MTPTRKLRMRGLVPLLASCIVAPALLLALCAGVHATSIVLDFETEDDFSTPLFNGQIVDPAFDGADLEFGNLVFISSTNIPFAGHLGATIFDSSDPGPNDGGSDKDLLVNLGNILILQNSAKGGTTTAGGNGLRYTEPNDEASSGDLGSIVFDFINPQELISIDLIDINGGVTVELTLTDTGGKTRTYDVPMMWTNDVTVNPVGYDTLLLNTLIDQDGEGAGGVATASEQIGFDPLQVVKLEVASDGSAGLDNLTFTPEPSSWVLAALAFLSLPFLMRRVRK